MIKWQDVLEKAKLCLNQDDLRKLTVHESSGRVGDCYYMVKVQLDMAESQALESVYNGDCDLAIFSNYRHVLDLFQIHEQYRDERYAAGS